MMIPMIRVVNVTQEDIERGQRGNGSCCPIAHAVKRALGLLSYQYCFVSDWGIETEFRLGREVAKIAIPEIVRDFIQRFDDGKYVEPFAFEIEYVH